MPMQENYIDFFYRFSPFVFPQEDKENKQAKAKRAERTKIENFFIKITSAKIVVN